MTEYDQYGAQKKSNIGATMGDAKKYMKWIPRGLLGIAAVASLATSFYTVSQNEEGVVTRFGKYTETKGPGGPYLKAPFGIEHVQKPKVTEVKRIEIGFRTVENNGQMQYPDNLDEALMLTGDENIAKVEFIVQYKIKDSRDYLFNNRDPEKTIKDASEAMMRRVIGDHSIDEALTNGKTEIQNEAQQKLQTLLDDYKMGVQVLAVQLQNTEAPDEVQASFARVMQEKEKKNQRINEALEYQNSQIPIARGTAAEIVRKAEGYHAQIVNEALGDASRFEQILEEYRKAPEITKKRLYIEAMGEITTQSTVRVIDNDVKGILPIMNLDKTK